MIDSEPFDVLQSLFVVHSQAESKIIIMLDEVFILPTKYYFIILKAINYDCLFLILVPLMILVIFSLDSTDVEGCFKCMPFNFILKRNLIDYYC